MFTKPKGTHYIELTCTARHRRVPLQVLQLLLDPLGSHRLKSEPKSIIHIEIHDQTTETMKQNTRHLPQRIKLFRAKQREISDLRQIDHVKTKPPSKIKIDHQPLEPRERWPPTGQKRIRNGSRSTSPASMTLQSRFVTWEAAKKTCQRDHDARQGFLPIATGEANGRQTCFPFRRRDRERDRERQRENFRAPRYL